LILQYLKNWNWWFFKNSKKTMVDTLVAPIKALKLRKIWDLKIFAQITDQASLKISNIAAMCRAAP
jgi:hypothetical protein